MKSHGVQLLAERELFALKILPTAREKKGSVRVYVNGEKAIYH